MEDLYKRLAADESNIGAKRGDYMEAAASDLFLSALSKAWPEWLDEGPPA
jgi:hypothetical protein